MEFPILSALAELGGAYARYCGRKLMRKLGGYEAAERRRVRRRVAVDKRGGADSQAVAEKRAVADKRAAAEKRAVAEKCGAVAVKREAAAGVPTLGGYSCYYLRALGRAPQRAEQQSRGKAGRQEQ